MSARVLLALAALGTGLTLAAAQPQISPSDMAGRERQRFIDSPVERYMKPGPYIEPDVIRTAPARKHRINRAKHAKDRKHP